MAKCKYIKEQEIVSRNGGVDWQNVIPEEYRKGQLIEYDSEDCSGVEKQYRWRTLEGVYLCDGDVKYEKKILDESYDNGLTWYVSYPSVYDKGNVVGVDEDYCSYKFIGHYVLPPPTTPEPAHHCPSNYRWNGYICVYVDPIKVIKCNGDSILHSGETAYYDSTAPLISCEIGNCVTKIGNDCFAGLWCSVLTSLDIPDSVQTIGEDAFDGCRSLSSVTIGNGCSTIGYGAFMGRSSLTYVTIGTGITNIEGTAFSACTGLNSITINATTPPTLGWNALEYTNNCQIFVPCESVSSYKSAWSSFSSRIQPIDTYNSSNCKWKAKYSGSYCYTVAPCDSTTISANEINGTNISEIIIGDCVTTIGENAFLGLYRGFSAMTSCTIGNNVTTIDDTAFAHCYSLKSIFIPDSVTSLDTGAFYYCSSLSSCTIGSGVTSIGEWAFHSCSGLTTVIVKPTTPPTLGMGAFNLTNDCPIYVPCNSVSAYKSASGWSDYASRIVGYDCPPIMVGKFNVTDITNPTRIGNNRTSFDKIEIDGVEQPSVVDTYTFSTTGEHTVEYTLAYPTTIGQSAFYGCSGLTSITIPDSVTTIGEQAFVSCTNLKRINSDTNGVFNIPFTVNSISGSAFAGCTSMTTCILPNAIKAINYSLFLGCINLTGITIPNNVTYIGYRAFEGCTSLTSATIPSGVTSINDKAYSGCTGLTSITCLPTTPPATSGWQTFVDTNNCPIYVPSGSVDTYKATQWWSYDSERIQAIT